ncbi:DegQ family serine endoprotease [Candidatus Venteria ishoeyi]|uniref:Periplasmic pH-dependent serine endoprotease DegQ n=1 Tax=Candidatus Venteria ishoeyi TaxID=1899563 RepID=A0A1H6FJ99_9GAMM|nr:DegQ family serine endoprotease [Candidatus Venteria ishoeyi]MDM8545696.1 DegQ family serine endoprotease [Candidatus Venteria ishoeyi]SEH09094.1 Periplasmic pH-dependent serine endoprotease DegQ precursor [Candidatus Venteria ishoeyi]
MKTPYFFLLLFALPSLSACHAEQIDSTGIQRVALPLAIPQNNAQQALPSLAPILEKAMPAVVNIATRTKVRNFSSPLLKDPFFRFFFDVPELDEDRPSHKTQSLGSGVIIDKNKGWVVTNHHVIADADSIMVTLGDGRELEAKLLGADSETDIALLEIPQSSLSSLPLADSEKLRVGDFVLAIGSPFGLRQTVTSGIISALGRTGLGIEGYEDFIQTDASINPGNSGGPLINLRGELIGINTAILAPGGGNIGIGFAIPVNMVKKITEHLGAYGEVRRGVLGVEIQEITPALAKAMQLEDQKGVIVAQVDKDSAAEKAGLKVGDIILSLDQHPITSSSVMRNRVGLLRVGETVQLSILRQGKTRQLSATIRETPTRKGDLFSRYFKGAQLSETQLSTNSGERLPRLEFHRVAPDSNADKIGLRSGDILLSLNRTDIDSFKILSQFFEYRHRSLSIRILRGEQVIRIRVY